MEELVLKLITKGDRILILLILIINTLPLLIPVLAQSDNGQKEIVINVDGKEVSRFPMEASDTSYFIDFEFFHESQTYEGKLEVLDSKVRLHRLPKEITPQAIHSDMGWISRPNQMIVALPVKLVITVEGLDEKDSDEDIDIISY